MASIQWSDIHHNIYTDFSGIIKVVTDEYAVKTSLNNILRTKFGERVMRPDFGCVLSNLLFENMNEQTRTEFTTGLKSSIERWEPRVKVLSLDVFFHSDSGEARVSIKFRIIGLEKEYETNVVV